MPDRPDLTTGGSGDLHRPNPHEGPKSDPVLKSGPEWVKSPQSSPRESTVTLYAANTMTIVASSFAHPSASTEVQLRSLENGAPKPVPLSRFYKWLLVALIVFAGLCVVAIVGLVFFVSPEPTSAQKDALALLKYLVTLVGGLVFGLFTGKQL